MKHNVKNKYNAKPTEIDGFKFHSQKEAKYYKELTKKLVEALYPVIIKEIKGVTEMSNNNTLTAKQHLENIGIETQDIQAFLINEIQSTKTYGTAGHEDDECTLAYLECFTSYLLHNMLKTLIKMITVDDFKLIFDAAENSGSLISMDILHKNNG